jgi:hypothetical protein
VKRPSEAECQRTIIEAAKLGGWLVHAERPAQTAGRHMTPIQGHAGFPDLVLVHQRRRQVVFIELKRKPNRVEPLQARWIETLASVGVDARVVWVPEQMDDFVQFLVDSDQQRLEL